MKIVPFICFFIFWFQTASSQCDVCGIYIGKKSSRSQTLEIKNDSTFVYKYTDNWASLMGATTTGKWEVEDSQIILNSKYDIDEYSTEEKWINYCTEKEKVKFLESHCDNLLVIEIENFEEESIWFLKSIMVNGDTSKIGTIAYYKLEKDENDRPKGFVFGENLSKVNIYNGFYGEFEVKIKKPKCNYLKIKGNFSDQLWYTYIKSEVWKIKKNKLVRNKNFGIFIRNKN